MKKVTVIGANSYIARNVIFTLQCINEDISLNLYDLANKQLDGMTPYHSINILDKNSVKDIDLNTDIIFFFVGKTGSANGFDDFDTFIDINEKALLYLLDEYRKQRSNAKIMFPSTRLVYKGEKGARNEEDEKEFRTIYSINKFAGEQYLRQYNRVFGIKYCIGRICIPYGTIVSGASSYGTADFMLKKALNGENITLYGDGRVRRTLTYIGDLCNILIKMAFEKECLNTIYNIGGEDYSLREMAEVIARKCNVGIDYIPYPDIEALIESGDTVFCDQRLNEVVSYKRTMTFEHWIESL